MTFFKFLFRVVVGLLAGYFGILGFGGQEAINSLIMVIICTAGLPLLLIIPAAYTLGMILTFWWLPLLSRKAQKQARNRATIYDLGVSSDEIALADWVGRWLDRGLSPEAIRTRLIENGWSPASINTALARATRAHQVEPH